MIYKQFRSVRALSAFRDCFRWLTSKRLTPPSNSLPGGAFMHSATVLLGLIMWIAGLAPEFATAQATGSSPEKVAANSAYEAKDWAKAVALYAQITSGEPANARAWYRLGVARHGLAQHQDAIAAFQKSI